jgi:uncharacterized membrane protein YeaQ/YmgE (transglycosylase-associated protein family)
MAEGTIGDKFPLTCHTSRRLYRAIGVIFRSEEVDDERIDRQPDHLAGGGSAGGNLAGNLLKQYNLGTLGNSIAGIVGGGLGGQLLGMLMGSAASGGGMDIGSLVAQVAGGGVGGGILLVIVGLVRQALGGGQAARS